MRGSVLKLKGVGKYMFFTGCLGGNSSFALKVGDRVRVKGCVSTPKYKWGSVNHHSVGVVTSLCPNGRDITVDFPMQGE